MPLSCRLVFVEPCRGWGNVLRNAVRDNVSSWWLVHLDWSCITRFNTALLVRRNKWSPTRYMISWKKQLSGSCSARTLFFATHSGMVIIKRTDCSCAFRVWLKKEAFEWLFIVVPANIQRTSNDCDQKLLVQTEMVPLDYKNVLEVFICDFIWLKTLL